MLLTALHRGDASGRSRARGSYGAGLARYLAELRRSGCSRSAARHGRSGRLRGKDDALDAARTARAALASDTLALPRARRAARGFAAAARWRDAAPSTSAAKHSRQLRAVIVTAPERPPPASYAICQWESCSTAAAAYDALSGCWADEPRPGSCCAASPQRIQAATVEADELERELLGHVRVLAPASARRARHRSDRGRAADRRLVAPRQAAIRSLSSPRLAGVAPVPASSGQTQRHRLSRGGDRQLNRALHTVVLHRRQHDPATRDYIERRVAEGKTRRDATRLLKRYLARHLYRLLEQTAADDLTSHRSIIPERSLSRDLDSQPTSEPGCNSVAARLLLCAWGDPTPVGVVRALAGRPPSSDPDARLARVPAPPRR